MPALSLLQVSEQSLRSYRQASSQPGRVIRETVAHDELKRMIRTEMKMLFKRIAVAVVFIPVKKILMESH